ncbi:MAG: hypothetical protein AVDCRST_MAG18-2571 [uncultured Thermomicrobiales bacterium]|uniref:Uncharacterized protein n=1 Tax=uncultured Thermomicrobiales bacterium TaxID=1645740 RepID=A0A6J4VDQ5_9BACT|nr:MAG: hypothetical protein AVDCRST_MAG18-2571 [uncultured Thermomicrobiales bacterium]
MFVMEEDELAVAGGANVGLDGRDAEIERRLERRQRILRGERGCAPMGDDSALW